MRRPIIAGNWKMYKTPSEGEALVRALAPLVKDAKAETVVCPPFTALDRVGRALEGSNMILGAQNVYWEKEGAFTGEIAPPMLRELCVGYVIVGHSERRQFFHESDETVNRRALAVLANDMRPIICVGERLEERESNRTREVVARQIHGALAGFSREQMLNSVIAYEPVWAIGTGKVATPEQAQEIHRLIRDLLSELFDAGLADSIRIQYGGSVKADNAAGLLSQPDIDGALVGGASLKTDSFAAIVTAA